MKCFFVLDKSFHLMPKTSISVYLNSSQRTWMNKMYGMNDRTIKTSTRHKTANLEAPVFLFVCGKLYPFHRVTNGLRRPDIDQKPQGAFVPSHRPLRPGRLQTAEVVRCENRNWQICVPPHQLHLGQLWDQLWAVSHLHLRYKNTKAVCVFTDNQTLQGHLT